MNQIEDAFTLLNNKLIDDLLQYIGEHKLVLIDGKQLAKFMIKYNVGVISQHSYTIKRIDTGYFEGE